VTIEGNPDGAMSADGRIAGTYLHRIFDNDAFRRRLLSEFGIEGGVQDYRGEVEQALDAVAAELESVLDPKWLSAFLD
jgi:adenosylcobyric acid synthase